MDVSMSETFSSTPTNSTQTSKFILPACGKLSGLPVLVDTSVVCSAAGNRCIFQRVMCVLKDGEHWVPLLTHTYRRCIMLKEKISVSVQIGKRVASDTTRVAKTTTVKAAKMTKTGSVKVVNTTVRATKKSTNFVADLTDRIPEIGADR